MGIRDSIYICLDNCFLIAFLKINFVNICWTHMLAAFTAFPKGKVILRHINLNSNQCESNKTFEVSSRQMYPFSIFLLAFLLLCTLHPCLQISRPVKCLCTKFVTNRRQHSVLHHLSTSTCNIIPKDICKYCIHSSDFLLPENRSSGKLR